MAKRLSDICFIVQARLNSSRLPGKMLKPFADSTLLEITIEKVKNSLLSEHFYLSVNEPELIEVAKKHEVKTYLRSEQSMRNDDTVPFSLTEVFEWWDKLPYRYYIVMDACYPLAKVNTINEFIVAFRNLSFTGLVSAREHKHWFFKSDGTFIQDSDSEDARITFNSKYVEPLYSSGPLKAGVLSDIGNNIYAHNYKTPPPIFLYPDDEHIDIDYLTEFNLAEQLYKLQGEYNT